MSRDKRYLTVRNLINGGYIKTFREIFDTLPKTVVAADLGLNNVRFTSLIDTVGKFYLRDIYRLAELLDVPEIKLLELITNQYLADRKVKKKR